MMSTVQGTNTAVRIGVGVPWAELGGLYLIAGLTVLIAFIISTILGIFEKKIIDKKSTETIVDSQ